MGEGPNHSGSPLLPGDLSLPRICPFSDPKSLPERIAAKRRELGLSVKEAAGRLEVDEGTFSRWESGEWKPRMSQAKVDRFLALKAADE